MLSSAVFIAISTVLALIAPLVYSYAILKGKAKPHRTTRIVLLLITSLATASLFAQGNRVAIWLAAVSFLTSIVIFVLSIKYGMGGWSKSDIICFVIALAGIVLWRTTNEPVLALYFSILADFTGMVPALIKTYKFPKTEVWTFYVLEVFAALFSLAAIQKWVLSEYVYPLYLLVINFAMFLLVIRPKFTGKSKPQMGKS